jgi:microcompartment protein CcmK/EutM
MILARVDGVIVTTVCHPSMVGCRSVICQPLDEHGRAEGAPILALDPLSAGRHQRVLVSTDGSHTREYVRDPKSPLRNLIMAIVDEPEPETA